MGVLVEEFLISNHSVDVEALSVLELVKRRDSLTVLECQVADRRPPTALQNRVKCFGGGMQIGEFRFLDETATLRINIYVLSHYRVHFLAQLVSSLLLHLLQFSLLLVYARLEELRHGVHRPFGLLRHKHESVAKLLLLLLLQLLLRRLGILLPPRWLHFRVDQA